MARNVFPLFGPSVPVMSIALGFADGSSLVVPRSGFLPTMTVYLPSLIVSLMDLRTSSGNGFPPSSAVDASQVPWMASVDTFTAREELIAYWESGWQRLFDSLAGLKADDLGRTVTIRGE